MIDKKNKIRKHKKLFSQYGFTLVELLVAMTVLGVIGYLAGSVLIAVFRGASKTKVVTDVRENGNFVITQITKTIRFAKQLDGVSVDDVNFFSNCLQPTSNPTPTPIKYYTMRFVGLNGGIIRVTCPLPIPNTTPTPTPVPLQLNLSVNDLIDPQSVALVPSSCYFTCYQNSALSLPTVQVNFSLSQPGPTGTFSENKAQMPFKSSVTLRNGGY